MSSSSLLAEQVEQRGVLTLECSIPEHMTIDEWRRRRRRRRPQRRRPRTPAAARHLAAVPDAGYEPIRGDAGAPVVGPRDLPLQ